MLLRANEDHAEGTPDTFVVGDTKANSAQPVAYPWNDNFAPALERTFIVNGVECKTGCRRVYHFGENRKASYSLSVPSSFKGLL